MTTPPEAPQPAPQGLLARVLGEESFLERPTFAQSYPRKPELDRLIALFVRGNHAAIRAEAPALAASTNDPEVAAAARDLRRRIDPDPLAYALLGITALLLLTLTAWALWRSAHMEGAPPRAVTTTQRP